MWSGKPAGAKGEIAWATYFIKWLDRFKVAVKLDKIIVCI